MRASLRRFGLAEDTDSALISLLNGESSFDHMLAHMLVEGLTEYAMFVVTPAGLVFRWNRGSERLFGYAGSEVIGSHFKVLFTPEDVAAGEPDRELADALSGPKKGNDRWHVRKDGSRFWGINTAQPLYDDHGTLLGFTKSVHDRTELYSAYEALRESEQELRALVAKTQHASLHDDLTNLANKPLFKEYVARAIARSERRPKSTFAVLFLDLDKFKTVNDSIGHVLADQLLRQVARRLERVIRAEDVLARFGGDEFAILLEDIDGVPDAILTAERILQGFMPPFALEGLEVVTSACIGLAVVSSHGPQSANVDHILEDADLAMYDAKTQGRARYAVFHDAMRTRAKAVAEMDKDLRGALERQEFRIYYRPVVDVRTRRINGFEALAQWQHPQRGLLRPAEFRSKAEEAGIIVDMEKWVLSEAARQLDAWHREFDGIDWLTMSLTLSAKGFERPGLAGELREILVKTALPTQSIAFEITEALTMETSDRILAVLRDIRGLGVEIHLGVRHRALVVYLPEPAADQRTRRRPLVRERLGERPEGRGGHSSDDRTRAGSWSEMHRQGGPDGGPACRPRRARLRRSAGSAFFRAGGGGPCSRSPSSFAGAR
jgi:diguanylate cyclase (GGDEF)-like protein/PAS domain S-box-containing protein